MLALGILCNTVASIFAKKASSSLITTNVQWTSLSEIIGAVFSSKELFLSIGFYGIAFIAYIFALSKISLHIAYPVFVSVAIILVTISSILIFGEVLQLRNIIGIAIIIIGIFALVLP